MTTAIEYKQRLGLALARGQAKRDPLAQDLGGYPADVTEIIDITCQLWHLRAPITKTSKALWIRDARELIDACAEYGIEALREYRNDFEDYMGKHQGVARHTVSGPGSLVKMVRDAARLIREAEAQPKKGYLDGEFASFIES
jgi:hypothetical protein